MKERSNKEKDKEIVNLLRSEDDKAITLAWEFYNADWHRLLKGKYPGRQDITEIINDSLMKFWKYRKSYDPAKSGVKTWVYSIAVHITIDRYRRKNRPKKMATQEDLVVYTENMEEAISNNPFSSMQKTILRHDLAAWPKKNVKSSELATLLNTNERSINSQRNKAYRKLSKLGVHHPLREKSEAPEVFTMDLSNEEARKDEERSRYE